ncbi:hypothetical protein ES703_44096 [subsurface metagenome]
MQMDIKRLKKSELYSEELGIYLKENNYKNIFHRAGSPVICHWRESVAISFNEKLITFSKKKDFPNLLSNNKKQSM